MDSLARSFPVTTTRSPSGSKIISRRHDREGGLIHRDIFRESSDFRQRQARINPVAHVEVRHPASYRFYDAGTLVSQCQGHGIILNQLDAAGEDEQLQRVHSRRLDLEQHFRRIQFRYGNIPQNCVDCFRIPANLNCFHGKNP